MKKSEVFISVISIVLLSCAGWVVGAWYTGNLIERNMDKLVSSTNAKIIKDIPEAKITISYQDYQRGIFSSSLRYVVTVNGEDVNFSQTIYHGPFPLDHLSLSPSFASMETIMEQTDTVKEIFSLTNGKSPLRIQTLITYNGDSEIDADTISFYWKGKEETVLSIDGYPLYAILALMNTPWSIPIDCASLKVARHEFKILLE
ncbi:GTP-binding protein (fragment) [Enterobacterales bacterium 8AC]